MARPISSSVTGDEGVRGASCLRGVGRRIARAAGWVAVKVVGPVVGVVAGRVSGGSRRASGSFAAARSATPAAWRSESCSFPAVAVVAGREVGRVGTDGRVAGDL